MGDAGLLIGGMNRGRKVLGCDLVGAAWEIGTRQRCRSGVRSGLGQIQIDRFEEVSIAGEVEPDLAKWGKGG
jgi:hypothetical protein